MLVKGCTNGRMDIWKDLITFGFHRFGRSHGTYLNNAVLVEPGSTFDINAWNTYIMGQMDKDNAMILYTTLETKSNKSNLVSINSSFPGPYPKTSDKTSSTPQPHPQHNPPPTPQSH